jgi:hypothetical protein
MKKHSKWIAVFTITAVLLWAGLLAAEKKGPKNSVNISGAGTVKGEAYHEINISGSGTIEKGATADTLNTSGNTSVEGKFYAAEIHTSGNFEAKDDLTAGKLDASGNFRVGGKFVFTTANLSGSVEIKKDLAGSEVTTSGSLSVGGNAGLGRLTSSGRIAITGEIHAQSVSISLYGKSKLGKVYCTNFEAKEANPGKLLKWLGFSPKGALTVDTIAATDITLERTEARVLLASKVKIGKGCKIGLVQYTDSLEVDKNAKVNKAVKK